MNIMLPTKKASVYWQFIISYIVLLIITIMIGYLTYFQTFQIAKSDAIQSIISALEQGMTMLDTRLMEVESMAMQLSVDQNIQAFMNVKLPLQNTDYDRIRDLYKKIPAYKLTNKFIFDTFIYFKNSETIVSPSYTSSRASVLYNIMLKYEDLSYEQWKDKLFEKYYNGDYWPVMKITSDSTRQNVITYLHTVNTSTYNSPSCVILVMIRESELKKSLASLQIQQGGWYYILDRNKNVITSENYSDDRAIDNYRLINENLKVLSEKGYVEIKEKGQKFFLIHTKSSYNNWTYVAAIPIGTMFKRINYIRNFYLLAIIVSFSIGLALAVYMAYRNSRPISELARKIKTRYEAIESTGMNEYDFISGTISHLIDRNTTLQEEREKLIHMMRAGFFERLFRSGFNRLQDIQQIMLSIDLDFNWDRYVVFVCRIEGFNNEVSDEITLQMDIARVAIVNILKKYDGDDLQYHHVEVDKIAFIYGMSLKSKTDWVNEIDSLLRNIINDCASEYNIRLLFGVGTIFESLVDAKKSFDEAIRALECTVVNHNGIILYSNIPKGISGYYYPVELEIRLMNLVKIGDYNEVVTILDAVFERNFEYENLSANMATELVYEMRSTITKLREQILIEDAVLEEQIETKLSSLEKPGSAKELAQSLKDIYKVLCDAVNERKKSKNNNMREQVLAFIQEHYSKSTLCLYDIASHFNLTETYFSQFFKEQVGETFSAYLENLRMKKAIELLKGGRLSINDIAQNVGYNNPNTFYKAFKRIYGVSPRAYKQQDIL